jgi:hypothetical protein
LVSSKFYSQPSLLGNWKLRQIIANNPEKGQFVIDLSNLEKVSNELFQTARDRYEESEFDSISLMANIKASLATFQKINLSIESNNTFVLDNYNLLVLISIPGWHLSDIIIGKWTMQNDTFSLQIGEESPLIRLKYKVKELSDEFLRIEEIDGHAIKEILFHRQ